MDNPYDYTQAGFDSFLSRSIDNVSKVNLDSQGPSSRTVAYDRTQISGVLGDTWKIGSIFLDGKTGRISIFDGDNEVVRIGDLGD